jgi:hypothetical protein
MLELVAALEKTPPRFHHFLDRWALCGTWVADEQHFREVRDELARASGRHLRQRLLTELLSGRLPRRLRTDEEIVDVIDPDAWERTLGCTPDCVIVHASSREERRRAVSTLLRPVLRIALSIEVVDRYALKGLRAALRLLAASERPPELRIFAPWGQRSSFNGPATANELFRLCRDIRQQCQTTPAPLRIVPVPVNSFFQLSHDRFIEFHLSRSDPQGTRVIQVGNGLQSLDPDYNTSAPTTFALVRAGQYTKAVRPLLEPYYKDAQYVGEADTRALPDGAAGLPA